MFDELIRSRAVMQRHLSSPLLQEAWSIYSIALLTEFTASLLSAG